MIITEPDRISTSTAVPLKPKQPAFQLLESANPNDSDTVTYYRKYLSLDVWLKADIVRLEIEPTVVISVVPFY